MSTTAVRWQQTIIGGACIMQCSFAPRQALQTALQPAMHMVDHKPASAAAQAKQQQHFQTTAVPQASCSVQALVQMCSSCCHRCVTVSAAGVLWLAAFEELCWQVLGLVLQAAVVATAADSSKQPGCTCCRQYRQGFASCMSSKAAGPACCPLYNNNGADTMQLSAP
jgi:hypothetical protein